MGRVSRNTWCTPALLTLSGLDRAAGYAGGAGVDDIAASSRCPPVPRILGDFGKHIVPVRPSPALRGSGDRPRSPVPRSIVPCPLGDGKLGISTHFLN